MKPKISLHSIYCKCQPCLDGARSRRNLHFSKKRRIKKPVELQQTTFVQVQGVPYKDIKRTLDLFSEPKRLNLN